MSWWNGISDWWNGEEEAPPKADVDMEAERARQALERWKQSIAPSSTPVQTRADPLAAALASRQSVVKAQSTDSPSFKSTGSFGGSRPLDLAGAFGVLRPRVD